MAVTMSDYINFGLLGLKIASVDGSADAIALTPGSLENKRKTNSSLIHGNLGTMELKNHFHRISH
jgi:hypothetical protein